MLIQNQAKYEAQIIGDLLPSDYVEPPVPAIQHFWEDYQDLDSHTQLLHSLVKAGEGKAKVSKMPGGQAVIILARSLDDDDGDYDDDDDGDDDGGDGNSDADDGDDYYDDHDNGSGMGEAVIILAR